MARVRTASGVVATMGALAVVVGVLAGCTGDGGDRDSPDTPPPEAVATTSPLDPYLDEIQGDHVPGTPDPWSLRSQEVLATCMAEQGFEYHIDENAGSGWYRLPDDYGTVAFAEQYGYGQSIPLEGHTVPRIWNMVPISAGMAANTAYYEGLTPEARIAYDIAIYGVYTESHPDYRPGGPDWDPELAGCLGRSQGGIHSHGLAGPAELDAAKEAVADVWRRVEEDARVVEAVGRWSDCMADAGHPDLATLMDAELLVQTVIWPAWEEEWIDDTGTNLGVTDYDVVRERIPDGLAELRRAEVELAVSDARCREESGYLAVRHEVEVEVEQEVLDTYRADLDAWVTWLRENRLEDG